MYIIRYCACASNTGIVERLVPDHVILPLISLLPEFDIIAVNVHPIQLWSGVCCWDEKGRDVDKSVKCE